MDRTSWEVYLRLTRGNRGGPNAIQVELVALGVAFRHSRPYTTPRPAAKVERFHLTMNRFLAAQPPARSVRELQAHIDRFVAYNQVRPHRAIGPRTPTAAFEARAKATPNGPKIVPGAGVRLQRDRIDKVARVTLRHRGRLHHIGVGPVHKGTRVILLIDGLDVRIVSEQGDVLRQLTLDPARDYQPHE